MRVILASASPRRKELLKKLFTDFEVICAAGSETYTAIRPSDIVQQLAKQKAAEVEQRVSGGRNPKRYEDYLIIGADTVVACNDQILGKPEHKLQAKQMLRMLAGTTHQVYTGVALAIRKNGKRQCLTFAERTNVRFYPMTEQEIEAYVCSGEPMDKAGGYGLQGIGGRYVQAIEGDYQNVIGLPVAKLYQVFQKIEEIALPF